MGASSFVSFFKAKIYWKYIRASENEFRDFDMTLYRHFVSTKTTKRELARSKRFEAKVAILHRINVDNNYFIFDRPTENQISKLGLIKLRKLRDLYNRTEFYHDMDQAEIDRFYAKLFIILEGAGRTADDLIFKSEEKIFEETLARIAKYQLLKDGLEKFLISLPPTPGSGKTLLERLRYYRKKTKNIFYKLFDSRVGRFLELPLVLPKVSNIKLNDEILYEIVMKGADFENIKLQDAFKSQNRIENYRIFKRIYQGVAIVVYLYIVDQLLADEIEEIIGEAQRKAGKKKARQIISGVEELKDAVDRLGNSEDEIVRNLKDEIYLDVIQSFSEVSGRPPTDDEKREIYFKVYKKYPEE